MTFSSDFLQENIAILSELDVSSIEAVAGGLARVRERGGRLFVLGVGGSAGHAGHAVNDFRKICGLEAYAPTDNVSELTARTNDEGWESVFADWLAESHLRSADALLIFSVGGGSSQPVPPERRRSRAVSVNLVRAIDLATEVGATIYGVVGRDGGYTAKHSDACVLVPPLFPDRVTAHTESVAAAIWHLLVSHPALRSHATKWEQVE